MGWFRSGASPEGERAPTFEERLASVGPGAPGHCPACDGLGYIDDLDLGQRYQIQHCKDCGHRWEYLFDGDGHVVGLTELDETGQPIARMRVRNRTLAAEVAEVAGVPTEVTEASTSPVGPAPVIDLRDHVIDLRDATITVAQPDGDEDDRAPGQMSPAEWLRHAVGR